MPVAQHAVLDVRWIHEQSVTIALQWLKQSLSRQLRSLGTTRRGERRRVTKVGLSGSRCHKERGNLSGICQLKAFVFLQRISDEIFRPRMSATARLYN